MRAPSIPPRVFGFVGTLVIVTLFSAFNLNHRSSVSFGFHTIKDVPVFITGLTAFTFGAVVMVPLVLRRARAPHVDVRKRRDEQSAELLAERGDDDDPRIHAPGDDGAETGETVPPDEPRRPWWRRWAAQRGDRKA